MHTMKRITDINMQNFIILEIYGINIPKLKIIKFLIQMIEERLMNITIEKIASNFLKSAGFISMEDRNYIENSDKKYLALYPIPREICDQYALISLLK